MRVWILACLLLCCSSCAPTYVLEQPSAALTADCEQVVLAGDTYRAALLLAVRQQAALAKCTAEKRALRGE